LLHEQETIVQNNTTAADK